MKTSSGESEIQSDDSVQGKDLMHSSIMHSISHCLTDGSLNQKDFTENDDVWSTLFWSLEFSRLTSKTSA